MVGATDTAVGSPRPLAPSGAADGSSMDSFKNLCDASVYLTTRARFATASASAGPILTRGPGHRCTLWELPGWVTGTTGPRLWMCTRKFGGSIIHTSAE